MALQYKRELLDFVNNLVSNSDAESVAFSKIDDRIVIHKLSKNQTMMYILSAPLEYFNIEETIAFYKYPNFYRFLSIINDPKLTIKDGSILISNKTNRVNYKLSIPDGINNGPEAIDDVTWVAQAQLTKEDLLDITRTTNLVKGNKAKFIYKGEDKLSINIHSTSIENSFDKILECDNITEDEVSFNFDTLVNIFTLVPQKHDYTLKISDEHLVCISLVPTEALDIEFNVYTSELE